MGRYEDDMNQNSQIERIADLLLEVKNGSKEALTRIYERYSSRLLGYGVRLCGNEDLALEMVQETFACLWEKRALYKPEIYENRPNDAEFYLFTIARNFIFKDLQRMKFKSSIEIKSHPKIKSPSETVLDEERCKVIEKAVLRLEPYIRETLVLVYFEGFKYRQVAEILGVSQKTIEWRMTKAFDQLRNTLKLYFKGDEA
jgi:RNA polymerase sigma-70 factor (ECF subfamily)